MHQLCIRNVFVLALSFAVSVVMALPADAQETIATVETQSEVNLSKPGKVRATIARVGQASAKEAVGKVLVGTVKINQTSQGPAITIDWNTVSSGGNAAAVPGLSSSFAAGNAARIAAGSKLNVRGNMQALARALSQLAPEEGEGEQAEAESEDGQGRDSSGQDTGSIGGGNNAKQNSLANPAPLSIQESATPTVETVATDAFGTTTDGCDPYLTDDETEVVITEAPTKNGDVTGPCVDSISTVPVLSSYIGCAYDERLDEMAAYAMKRRYYVYGPNTTYIDNECTVDEDTSFAMYETPNTCSVVVAPGSSVAVQHTKVEFLGRRNEVNEAVGGECAAREGETFDIVFDTNACPMRDDFDANVTWERHKPMFRQPDGRLLPAGECEDTETFFVHQKDFSVCDPFADFSENKLYPQYRVRIEVTGADRYRTAVCQPETNVIANLTETGAGCESYHFDYDGYSHGAMRILRSDTDEEVRGCLEGTTRYEHQREAQDWQRDDANLRAFPSEATFINLPSPTGKTYVGVAVVRDDATPTDYTLLRTYLKNTSVEYVTGSCNKFQNRDTIEVYSRPDGTEYEHNAGVATALGPNNACDNNNSPFTFDGNARNVSTGQGCDFRTSCGGEDGSCTTSAYNTVFNVVGEFSATHQLEREDGQVISTDSATKEYTCTGLCGGGGPSHCPAVAPNSAAEQFYIELGWN